MSKLVIVGTVAFDAIETPFGKTDKILGGAATFIGLASSQFNIDATIVSIVGGDFPQGYLDLLSEKHIDISGIELVEEGKTFFWSGNRITSYNVCYTKLLRCIRGTSSAGISTPKSPLATINPSQ